MHFHALKKSVSVHEFTKLIFTIHTFVTNSCKFYWIKALLELFVFLGTIVTKQLNGLELSQLSPWTKYKVSVAAATEAGVGVAAEEIECTTLEDGKLQIQIMFSLLLEDM